jgi:glycosyl hydrolase family 44
MRERCLLFAVWGLAAWACGGGGTPTAPAAPGAATPTPPPGPAGGVRFTIDSQAGRVPISPFVYGTNEDLGAGGARGLRLGRLGGNRWTAYNWENNASNAGSDFQHQNDGFLGGGNTAGEAVRPHVASAFAAGASIVVTVPIAGYVSADKAPGGDVNQTPDYLHARFKQSRAAKGAGFAYPPDTGDDAVYQDEFVAWLESVADARRDPSRTIFYSLDNEPDLWASTHPRIRPTGPVTYAEILDRTTAYAAAIKSAAPQALVFGPVSYGWNGFVTLQDAPDRSGRDFLDFYLSSLRDAEGRARRRLVDVLDLHWYPEARGGGVRITESSGAPDVAAARVQAPRSLWDPGYVETSWISQDAGVGAIRLLPRMREKIAASYPGTRLAITEYNYGGGEHISGAIAQADVLGIFGREGLFAAALWKLGSSGRFIDAGFAAFCNYDGALARFGDTAVAAATSDVQATSVYASVDQGKDDRMVIVAINKATGPTTALVTISHPVDLARGQAYQITAASPAVVKGPTLAPTGRNTFELEMPASSVTTLVLER